jgi:CRISPR-associated protein Cas2
MPYLIAVYDVGVKRNARMLKLFRRYLTWVQNSVFEGELSPAQVAELEAEATKRMEAGDVVVLYVLRTRAYSERRVLGVERGVPGPFV